MQRSIVFVLFFLALDSCIERAEFPSDQENRVDIVVDGAITNDPGPYTVKLSRTIQVGSTLGGLTISNAKITLRSDAGESEQVFETRLPGTYQTSASGIRGVIGRSYWLEIQLPDGRKFESLPDQMLPVGRIDSLYHQFETFVADNGSKSYGFRVFINAETNPEERYTRWRFDGPYAVTTIPQLFPVAPPTLPCGTEPLPCSGWKIIAGQLVSLSPCTCCECWANQFESKPTVRENNGSKVIGLQVGFVPVNYDTFQDKYRVTVT